MATCFSCGATLEFDRVYRNTECPSCANPVKVCKNCRFFQPGAHWDCRETIPDPVRDKEKSNFCDYFQLSDRSGTGDKKTDGARDNLKKLFGE